MLGDFKCDECGRLNALGRLNVLDSAVEQPFENIVALVQQILQVPISTVTLVDKDRQWFKAKRGLAVSETPRDVSFCTFAIQNTVPFIVNDATTDPRFAANPLVTGDPHIRSYAGIPLMTADGYNVGSLCAIDRQPREFSSAEIAILVNFAKVVVDELELRQIAATDQLTGVMSRRAWFDTTSAEVRHALHNDLPLALLVIDIDHFKAVNDRHGHTTGDRVIKHVAKVAKACLRDTDGFGRFGGEEFVAVFPGLAKAEAMAIADRMRHAISVSRLADQSELTWTVSIGVADLVAGDDSLSTVLERADQALYRAKAGGRNRVHGAETALESAA